MEKVGNDGIGGELSGFRKKATITRDIKKSAPVDGRHWNSFFCEAWREFTEFAESDDMVFELVCEEWQKPEEGIFPPTVSEGLDDVEDFFLILHRFRCR